MDPAHAAQYNWQLVEEVRPKYRMDIAGRILEGPIYFIHNDQPDEERWSGYFKSGGCWYAVHEVRWSYQLTVTWLRGTRVKFNRFIRDGALGEIHIRIVRTPESENISQPFCIQI